MTNTFAHPADTGVVVRLETSDANRRGRPHRRSMVVTRLARAGQIGDSSPPFKENGVIGLPAFVVPGAAEAAVPGCP